jgi:GNAT superfamily N-acetyltransferase
VLDEGAFRNSFAELISSPQTFLTVTEEESQVIGYVLAFSHPTVYANGRVAWVEEIMVHPNWRRRGAGKSLMQSAEDWAANQECGLIALATRWAASFYKALGYEASATYFKKLL